MSYLNNKKLCHRPAKTSLLSMPVQNSVFGCNSVCKNFQFAKKSKGSNILNCRKKSQNIFWFCLEKYDFRENEGEESDLTVYPTIFLFPICAFSV